MHTMEEEGSAVSVNHNAADDDQDESFEQTTLLRNDGTHEFIAKQSPMKKSQIELEMTSLTAVERDLGSSEEEREKVDENIKKLDEKIESRCCSRKDINRYVIAALMLIASLLVNSCFSVIAPFYPQEVKI